MKKIAYFSALFSLLFVIGSCNGYKPIFSSSNLNFKIANYTIEGEKKLGKKIYRQLNDISQSNKNADAKSINILINTTKNKVSTIKDSTGKILEYKISLNSKIVVTDFLTDREILNNNFFFSSSYKVQDQYFDTIKYENKTQDDMINKTYQDLLIKLSEKIGNDN